MTSRDELSARQITRKAIPIEKAHIHDTAIAVNTDFLEEDITPSAVGPQVDTIIAPVLFRIMIQLDTAAVFAAMVDDGESEVTLEFNAGAQLVAGALYIFDMLVNEGDSINFQVDQQGVSIDKFIVHEVLWAGQ